MYVLNVIIRAKLFKKIETVSINEMYPIAYKKCPETSFKSIISHMPGTIDLIFHSSSRGSWLPARNRFSTAFDTAFIEN